LWKQDLSRFELKNNVRKIESKMIQLRPFKEKEGRSPLGGQWKKKEKVLFHLFSLFPHATLLRPSSFSLILRFYFTMVLGYYLHLFSFSLSL
jgi:hypothetical protein